ncbi:hypothetical protein IFM89_026848 [Coptis chinensis]|uniref:Uncharacterized protein n=1 Tax=Coptis chinensis TaxID=261450 RepID=A0A835HVQ3_9MAGN|nr:hypothetical protein IFM89_026848 [Coptis chinensis]
MAAGAAKSVAFALLVLNLVFYFIVSILAGWALNYGVENTPQTVAEMTIPAHLFPVYFPIGNMATAFFVVFSLIAGLVGMATSIAGITNIIQWTETSLLSAASSSIITWSLTLLAMGLACKEINIGGRDTTLRALETFTIILSGTQLFCTGAIHAGVTDAMNRERSHGGRV